jgi:hypothetical protein
MFAGMLLRTVARDCLFLNWALPLSVLPDPPPRLRYQVHAWQGESWVFASAVFCHHGGVHLEPLPRLRISYPQLDLRLSVFDGDGIPSVLYCRMLMPAWVVPWVRLVTRQPASAAHLECAQPARHPDASSWTWRVERGGRLEVRARLAAPQLGEGPVLGSWDRVLRYFHERPRGYAAGLTMLHRVDSEVVPGAAVPLAVEIEGEQQLPRLFGLPEEIAWPRLHSAWLCPEMPFSVELGFALKLPAHEVGHPEPVAGRALTSPHLRSWVGDRR